MTLPNNTQKYWNENIEKWGEFYLDISHSSEELNAPKWLAFLYKKFIMPMEAKVMTHRFRLTMDFIDQYIVDGMTVADVGCGTGIFTVEMLRRGARVIAVDFSQNSLDLTRTLVERLVPEKKNNVEYLLADVSQSKLPASDAVLAMGVTPYLQEIAPFYRNILPTTKIFYCLILDPNHWANVVRRVLPFLNVRDMHWFSRSEIDASLDRHNWRLLNRQKLSSGYLDLAESRNK
jgi:cyclopropane fatty-acyl-phospholipid synthase-like methyltransferase